MTAQSAWRVRLGILPDLIEPSHHLFVEVDGRFFLAALERGTRVTVHPLHLWHADPPLRQAGQRQLPQELDRVIERPAVRAP